jgi:hypothetical protein
MHNIEDDCTSNELINSWDVNLLALAKEGNFVAVKELNGKTILPKDSIVTALFSKK